MFYGGAFAIAFFLIFLEKKLHNLKLSKIEKLENERRSNLDVKSLLVEYGNLNFSKNNNLYDAAMDNDSLLRLSELIKTIKNQKAKENAIKAKAIIEKIIATRIFTSHTVKTLVDTAILASKKDL